jgi:large repetitive protein
LGVKGGSSFQVTGDYKFRLLNFTNATAFIPGAPIVDTLNPAMGTVLYKFTGNAGDKYYYDGQQATGFIYPPFARVYSPYGDIVAFASLNTFANTFTLPVSGTYTVTVEGRIYETQSTGNYGFNLIPVTYPTNALTTGNTVTGTLATKGLVNYYTFTLPVDSTLYFDALTRADFYWRLDALWGQAVDWRSFGGSDSQEIGDPALRLPAGNYVLGLKGGSGFQVTGDYKFRLLNFTNATPFTPGAPVTGTLNPAIGTVFYKFTASAGDRFYFDGLLASGFDYAPYCRIYAPEENGVMGQLVNGDQDTFTVLQNGTYTLTVEGRIYENKTSGSFTFNLVPNPLLPDKPLYNTNVAPDVTLSAPFVDGDTLSFSFATAANHTYTVQYTSGLEEPVLWQTLRNVIGNNAVFRVTDVIPQTGNRFYRVRVD